VSAARQAGGDAGAMQDVPPSKQARWLLATAREVLRGGARTARRLPSNTSPASAILTEIAQTVLPRRLVFTGRTGQRMTLEAGGGRLTRFVDFQPSSDRPPAFPGLAEARRLGQDHAEAAMDCIAAFGRRAAGGTVVAEPLPPSAKLASGGLSPDDLRRHLGAVDYPPPDDADGLPEAAPAAPAPPKGRVRPDPAAATVPIGKLPERLRMRLLTALRGFGVTASRGRVDVVAEMEKFAIADLLRSSARDRQKPHHFLDRLAPGAKLVLLSAGDGSGAVLGYTRDDRETLTICVTAEAVGDTVALWQAHLDGTTD
jgi:hypothetical protein